MGKESSIKSLKTQNLVWRVLKIAFYLAGFLLLFHLVRIEVRENLGGHFFSAAAQKANYIMLGAWAVVFAVQLLCAVIFRKSAKARMVIVAIVAFAVIAAPVVYLDFFIKKEFDKLAVQYAEKDLEFDSYEIQLDEYGDLASELNSVVTDFTDYYNIEYSSKVYGSKNTDWSPYAYTEDGVTFMSDDVAVAPADFFLDDAYVFGQAKGDAYYSKNGMYADGYIFGFKQARYILETYYSIQQKYLAAAAADPLAPESADKALELATDALRDDTNSAWNNYITSEEYLEFYGEDLTDVANAKRYYITEDRLDEILQVLGVNLEPYYLGQRLFMFMGVSDASEITLDDLLGALSSFGFDLDPIVVTALLAQFSFYQSPQTFPIFYFIEDDELREYAYADYYGRIHGAVVGSVLIGDRVGEVTMDENGNPAEEDIGDRLQSFQRMDLDKDYMVQYFPWMALRYNFLIFAGIIPFSIIAAYFCASMERKSLKKLINGGNR